MKFIQNYTLFPTWGIISVGLIPMTVSQFTKAFQHQEHMDFLPVLILVFLIWASMYVICLYKSFVAKSFDTSIGVLIGIILSSLLMVPSLIKLISVPLYISLHAEPFLMVLSYLNYLIIGIFTVFTYHKHKKI